ncbi:MAG: tetratricopeptide repeat protein, partial [Chloroflexota bacterium]
RNTKKGRVRRTSKGKQIPQLANSRLLGGSPENWETWLGGQALAMAIIFIILVFNFVTPQFQFSFSDQNSLSLLWMFTITWFAGLAIAFSDMAIRQKEWRDPIDWVRAVMLYVVISLSYLGFYLLAHNFQFGQRIVVTSLEDVVRAANVLAYGLVVFYISLLVLILIFGVMLSWRQMRGATFWRVENWWLYPILAVAMICVIWFKNVNVVLADVYLKEGERYRNQGQWDQAIRLHEKAVSLDSDEDFFYLMLALDYQLMAQDGNLPDERRQIAWAEGERIALQAREINPYNPDNTGNMGRYYFTLGQVLDQARFQDALSFFEKATKLAPSNITYHNLWAQTHYILGDFDSSVERLKISTSIDNRFGPTWLLLGDTYAAQGNVDGALEAHSIAMTSLNGTWFNQFADHALDQRLSFYGSHQRGEEIIAIAEQVGEGNPTLLTLTNRVIARMYMIMGETEKAVPYLEDTASTGNATSAKELANIHLSANELEQALPYYEIAIQQNPNDFESYSALAYIYSQQGRIVEAIEANLTVLRLVPNDYDSSKNLAILYQQNQQLPEALSWARTSRDLSPEADIPQWDALIASLESQVAPSE